MSDKITAAHLSRPAYIYIRQSTQFQVRHNLESQRRQYGLVERAKELGWKEVEVIDEDLGRSGSGSQERKGFERLVAAVSLGRVGAVVSLEASRLARNNRDWHKLVDLCGMTATALIDQDGVYLPDHLNDRLLLGLKGTMSEFELSLLRQRALEGLKAKAKRGELYSNVPIGYVRTADDRCEKDPDLRIQQAVRTVFEKFEQVGTARQVLLWFRQENIPLPNRQRTGQGSVVQWRLPVYQRIRSLLANPFYAGAYAYGRRATKLCVKDGHARKRSGLLQKREDWMVLLNDHHAGYIAWEQYEKNQTQIRANADMKGLYGWKGAPRRGSSLLAGLLRCGGCGRSLYVGYSGRALSPRYECRWTIANHAGPKCTSIGASRIEKAVGEKILQVLEPLGVEAALLAAKESGVELGQKRRAQDLALEQARYESERARRQYDAVDPENRIVACELEKRWNVALEHMGALEKELAESPLPEQEIGASEQKRLLALGGQVRAVWANEGSDARLKKRIVRTLIEGVIVDSRSNPDFIEVTLHWKGGQHSQVRIGKFNTYPRRGQLDKETVELVRELAEVAPDKEIARILNRLGRRTGQGHTWTGSRVVWLRHHHGIAVYDVEKHRRQGLINMAEAAQQLGISTMSVLRLIREGIIPSRQAAQYAPRIIKREDLAGPIVAAAVASIKKRAGIPLPENPNQEVLDFQ